MSSPAILQPDAGEIRIDGRPAALVSPLASRAAGIAVVYQELSLCPTLSVADNIMHVRHRCPADASPG